MENNIEKKEEIINNKILNDNQNNGNNKFIKFLEEYYGFFKQFISFEELYKICKVNHNLLSLFLVDKGNKLYHEKDLKLKKLKHIIALVRIIFKIHYLINFRIQNKIRK